MALPRHKVSIHPLLRTGARPPFRYSRSGNAQRIRAGAFPLTAPSGSVTLVQPDEYGKTAECPGVFITAHPETHARLRGYGGTSMTRILATLLNFVLVRPYLAVKRGRVRLGLKGRKASPEATEVTVVKSIASTVYLDRIAGTASKEYTPPLPVKLVYWLSFQSQFPYVNRRDALLAAAHRRKVAGLLTKYRFGYDLVAQVIRVERNSSRYRLVTELVPGTGPKSNREVGATLKELSSYFEMVGLPTWQVSPSNPGAYSNFILTPAGQLKLVDFESALVSPIIPPAQLGQLVRQGLVPGFDDIDFPRLRGYVTQNAASILDHLGGTGLAQLEEAISACEEHTQLWKESEPRIWGRLARRLSSIPNPAHFMSGLKLRLKDADQVAQAFLNDGLQRWVEEKRIDEQQAAKLHDGVEMASRSGALRHLGALLILTVVLRFPVGSIARFGWVVSFRVKAHLDSLRGKIAREEYRLARSIHSIPVMLFSLAPGIGGAAYFASTPMRKAGVARLMIDQSATKLPFSLYRRLRLERILPPSRPS